MTFNSTKKVLLATAVSSAMVASANLASAADLNALSDDELLQRIEKLEKALKGKGNIIRNKEKAVKVTISGQVNNKLRFATNGEDTDVRTLDNNESSNRFRVEAKGKLNDRFSVSTRLEIDFERASDSGIGLGGVVPADADSFLGDQDAGEGDTDIDLRVFEAKFKDKVFGTLSVGVGDTASNGSFERDISGAGLAVGNATFSDDAVEFVDADGNFVAAIGEVLDGQDGLSREQRIRYDTPSFQGFSAAASYIGDRTYDLALNYKTKNVAGFSVDGRAAYFAFLDAVDASDGNEQSRGFTGSISFLHNESGLNFTGGYANVFDDADIDDDDLGVGDFETWFVKAGIKRKIFSIGSSAFAVDYQRATGIEGDDLTVSAGEAALVGTDAAGVFDGLTAQSVGVNFTQKITKLSTEVYIGYRWHNLDSDTGLTPDGNAIVGDVQDIHIVNTGARVKF